MFQWSLKHPKWCKVVLFATASLFACATKGWREKTWSRNQIQKRTLGSTKPNIISMKRDQDKNCCACREKRSFDSFQHHKCGFHKFEESKKYDVVTWSLHLGCNSTCLCSHAYTLARWVFFVKSDPIGGCPSIRSSWRAGSIGPVVSRAHGWEVSGEDFGEKNPCQTIAEHQWHPAFNEWFLKLETLKVSTKTYVHNSKNSSNWNVLSQVHLAIWQIEFFSGNKHAWKIILNGYPLSIETMVAVSTKVTHPSLQKKNITCPALFNKGSINSPTLVSAFRHPTAQLPAASAEFFGVPMPQSDIFRSEWIWHRAWFEGLSAGGWGVSLNVKDKMM